MAAVALQNTTVDQLNKIIGVVGKKSFNLVQGIKTSVAPQLNKTIADTLAAPFAGDITFEFVKRYVDDIINVSIISAYQGLVSANV